MAATRSVREISSASLCLDVLFLSYSARLFYRAAAQHIKLVAVDEPSASLDPKMEYELFESLRALSTAQGKTMVIVMCSLYTYTRDGFS
jgi:wobble nucleotide-excising tRNase